MADARGICGGDSDSDDANDLRETQLEPESGTSSGSDTEGEDKQEDLEPVRAAIIVMTAIIQGYTLIGPLQHDLKVKLSIGDTGQVGHVFTTAVTSVQYGKMVMTLGQNALLACFSPKLRVYLAMAVMFVGCLIPLCIFLFDLKWVGLVFISYFMIGLALGVFEPTFVSVITPLGPQTKSWAIMGFPMAFGIVNIIGMTLIAMGMSVEVLFAYIAGFIPVGFFVFRKIMPEQQVDAKGRSHEQVSIMDSFCDWQSWLLRMIPFLLANFVSHFAMECIVPANLNTFNANVVPLFGRYETTHLMNKRMFFVVFFIFVLIGDSGSRRFVYLCCEIRTYKRFVGALWVAFTLNILGIWLTTLGIGVVSWASALCAFTGNGANYAISARYIDKHVPRKHNLAAYSFWMFIGYIGAILGSQLVDLVRYWVCMDQETTYQCHASHGHR
mmetsp:Transcript_40748/g.105421  ORF Transcript_40748/g.105421 Transcript_40748/m.105421 type:complete len:441 (+) Transcript_40748:93-1415(+)